jgi:nucleoid DNA-binding protein
MLMSELIERIVNAMLDAITAAMAHDDRVELWRVLSSEASRAYGP